MGRLRELSEEAAGLCRCLRDMCRERITGGPVVYYDINEFLGMHGIKTRDRERWSEKRVIVRYGGEVIWEK